MNVTISPSAISGTLVAPASKSSMQRACALALLADGETVLYNPGKSNDDLAALEIIKNLGAQIHQTNEGSLLIKSSRASHSGGGGGIHCGESGLGIRMFAPIAALSADEMVVSGSGSLLVRPMHFFDEIFPRLGISIQSNNGHLPIKIKGPLQPADITMDGSLSSQFLTGLLIAFGRAVTKPVTITVNNLKSKPYIDLTLQMMKQFGYDVANNNYENFVVAPKPLDPKMVHYTVEGDWSGAAFLLVAGAIAGGITITGLAVFSTQADKAILKALVDCGANISIEEKQIVINHPLGNTGKAFHFDATDCPDLFPPLVALAAYCEGVSVIEGVDRLLHKESNRALTLQEEFKKMGVNISLQNNLMMIEGNSGIHGATVHSRHDHRIAMACAIAALKANGETVIEEAQAVNKSYPGFFEDLKLLHAAVSLQ
ncbi:MAG: 3-phosphoshikimate 1-carboxyvinyltransferase [Chitinophagaceae bacterium]|nr:3-phosphoshikimate 1-carboxyvinyltransferase [Chitinophagaceae bacterium]